MSRELVVPPFAGFLSRDLITIKEDFIYVNKYKIGTKTGPLLALARKEYRWSKARSPLGMMGGGATREAAELFLHVLIWDYDSLHVWPK